MKTGKCAILYVVQNRNNDLKRVTRVWMGFNDSFFPSVHTATPALEDYEQVYIVHTGFVG